MSDKARILFVDDEQRVLNSMRGLFRRDYELFLTTEGKEAVRIATESSIDVIVADQRMPGMTGVEVLGKIKELSPRTVRILLTGYADPAAVEGSINIGEVFRFLSKPCPPQLLRDTLGLAIAAARTKPKTPGNRPSTTERRQVASARPAAPQRPVTAPAPMAARPPREAPTVHRPAPAQATPARLSPPRPPSFVPVQASQEARSIEDNENTEPALPILQASAANDVDDESSSEVMSVTNVVMSEDRTEETQENIAFPGIHSDVEDVGVVVFTVDSEFAATAIRAMGANRNTILATTLVKVAHAIEALHAGVLVTDFTTNSAMLQRMVGVLKQHVPQLATVVVSNSRDTTDMINLINYGQIFRYVLKPVEPQILRNEINAAAVHYLHLINNPESAKRHEVIESSDAGDSSLTLNRFVARLREHQARRNNSSDVTS